MIAPQNETATRSELDENDSNTRQRTPAKAFAAEAVIGVIIGLCILAALVTGTAEIPFVYQGY